MSSALPAHDLFRCVNGLLPNKLNECVKQCGSNYHPYKKCITSVLNNDCITETLDERDKCVIECVTNNGCGTSTRGGNVNSISTEMYDKKGHIVGKVNVYTARYGNSHDSEDECLRPSEK